MRNIRDIEIIKAVIHIMDNSMEEPVLNDLELQLDEEVVDFIEGHIIKSTGDEDAKCAVFNEGQSIMGDYVNEILQDEGLFLEKSREIARTFFNYTRISEDMQSGDLIVCLFNCEYGKTMGVMKLDYNRTYIHNIDYIDERMSINILPQMIGLPGKGQRLNNAFFVCPENQGYNVLLIDRKSKRNSESGENIKPLNELLNCSIITDKRTMTRNIINTSEKWIRENIKDDAGAQEKARSTISKALRSDDVVNLETVAHYAFENNEDMKKEYIDTLINSGLDKLEVPVDRDWAENKLKRKKLKIDSDIDIYINSNAYEDSGRFEVKRNGDGTINIVIKHVRNYIEKP